MIRLVWILFSLAISSLCEDSLMSQKQNTLYVQNLIELEEKIARNFEKYILTEFKLPAMSDLIDDKYLGSNFSVKNRMGIDIAFLSASELKIKYLIEENITTI